jgi:hypothetical protein
MSTMAILNRTTVATRPAATPAARGVRRPEGSSKLAGSYSHSKMLLLQAGSPVASRTAASEGDGKDLSDRKNAQLDSSKPVGSYSHSKMLLLQAGCGVTPSTPTWWAAASEGDGKYFSKK